jgi:serine-type D-Ala-D-Ala carboxypeptidase/endopeptidase (penicillin-binding protein 4)
MKEKLDSKNVFALGPVVLLACLVTILLFQCPVGLVNASPTKQFSDDSKQVLQKKIFDLMTKNKINPEHFGIQINRQNVVLFANKPDKIFIPASVTKLFTAYAVLKNLGPTFKVKTQLFYDGKNLFLKGAGDPGFVSETMWFLVNEFYRHNIKKIEGDILVDDSLFDDVRFDKSREATRVDRAFDSPVGAMSFNWNSVNIYVKPATKIGQAAQVVADPENGYFKMINTTSTTNKLKKDLIIDVRQKDREIRISGDVLISAAEKAYYKNVADPVQWSGLNLVAFLEQRGISVKGSVKPGLTPATAQLMASAESKSLSAMVADMDKFSNNYVAEMLTKLLASQKSSKIEKAHFSISDGMKIIEAEADRVVSKSTELVLKNPSGFSRENRITPAALNELLYAAELDFSIFPSLVESLPVAGLDGTLKRRMVGTKAENFVRAKTGYLDGVVALSGYAGHKNGELYHFTFLYNGPQDEALVRTTVDQIINFLLE